MLSIEIRVITKLPNRQISQQPENCENRNDPDLVQAFLKKWWVESDFKMPNLPLSLRIKGSGCHYNSIYNNTVIIIAFIGYINNTMIKLTTYLNLHMRIDEQTSFLSEFHIFIQNRGV